MKIICILENATISYLQFLVEHYNYYHFFLLETEIEYNLHKDENKNCHIWRW